VKCQPGAAARHQQLQSDDGEDPGVSHWHVDLPGITALQVDPAICVSHPVRLGCQPQTIGRHLPGSQRAVLIPGLTLREKDTIRLRWAVAIQSRGLPFELELGQAICRELSALGRSAKLVEDGENQGLMADVLLLVLNLANFGAYGQALRARRHRRPEVIAWLMDPLPPPSLSAEAERIGLAAARWQDRLRIRQPRRHIPAARRVVTLHKFRQWLYKQVSRPGFRRTAQLLQRGTPELADLDWRQMRGVLHHWECLRRARAEGWLDHCVVSTLQRQRFLETRDWPATFVPVGAYAELGRRLDGARDLDVLFLGSTHRNRRVALLQPLQAELGRRGVSIMQVGGACFGEERTRLLNRARILVNFHNFSWNPAWMRFVMASLCGAVVVSEPTIDDRPFRAGEHYIAATPAAMPDVICRLLEREPERRAIAAAAHELCKTSLTMHRSVTQICALIT